PVLGIVRVGNRLPGWFACDAIAHAEGIRGWPYVGFGRLRVVCGWLRWVARRSDCGSASLRPRNPSQSVRPRGSLMPPGNTLSYTDVSKSQPRRPKRTL